MILLGVYLAETGTNRYIISLIKRFHSKALNLKQYLAAGSPVSFCTLKSMFSQPHTLKNMDRATCLFRLFQARGLCFGYVDSEARSEHIQREEKGCGKGANAKCCLIDKLKL